MARTYLLCGALLALLSATCYGDDGKAPKTSGSTNAAMEKMKSLVGTWVAADDEGKPTDQVVSVIRLTAGGSALHETLFPGQEHEMISMYTVDGNDLVLTHYCVLGNQPRMKGELKGEKNQIAFEFVGGSNLDPKKDRHMHSATLTFVDKDHLQIEGCGWENGEPSKEMCHPMKLVRKK